MHLKELKKTSKCQRNDMRAIDEYVILIENPNSNNILRLVKAYGKEKIEISEEESKKLFIVLNEKFEIFHENIKKFDDELWEILEHIDISVDWLNVISAYREKQQNVNLTQSIHEQPRKNHIKIPELNELNFIKETTPKLFLEVEESYKNNSFISEIKNEREKLVKVIWELYKFSNQKKEIKLVLNNSIDWDLFYKLITFTYEKILSTKKIEKSHKKNAAGTSNDEKNILNEDFKRIKEICISLSTLAFLSPVASSRGCFKYAETMYNYAVNQFGESPFANLFVGFQLGNLKYINTNESNAYESQWMVTNILSVLSGFLGHFLDDQKYFKLLKSYNENASETFINEFPNGADEDYSRLISMMTHLANPDWVKKEHILRFINTLSEENINKSHITELIYSEKNKLINLDSASLLLSNPLINYYINNYDLDSIEKKFIQILQSTNDSPKVEGLWSCNNIFDFESITYQSAYFKSSRTLLVACSTFWLIDEDPLSLVIEGCEKLNQEGFSNCALVFLIYNLLYFSDDSDFKKIKISHVAHKNLYNFLSKTDVKKEINESYFQILDYCSKRIDSFGFLFCEVINNIKNEFKFNNVIKVDFKKIDTVKDGNINIADNLASLNWMEHNSNESFLKIFKEISNLRHQPPIGIWERKYKNIIGDIKILFGELDTVTVKIFNSFYQEFSNELMNIDFSKCEEFKSKIFNIQKQISLGSIPKLFYEINEFKRKNPKEFESILTKIQNKKIFFSVKRISESEQLQISLNAIVKYRHQFSHSNDPLKLTSIKHLLMFVESDMNDFLKIFKTD
jgi:hypothetical protein